MIQVKKFRDFLRLFGRDPTGLPKILTVGFESHLPICLGPVVAVSAVVEIHFLRHIGPSSSMNLLCQKVQHDVILFRPQEREIIARLVCDERSRKNYAPSHGCLHRWRWTGRHVARTAPRQAWRRRYCPCLLYTSDAADERSSVDLGGR